MKMKILFCCLCMLVSHFDSLKATEEPVILRIEANSKQDMDDRSIQMVPTASHDGRPSISVCLGRATACM